MGKLAVVFPGIGYHCDKPLLYYSKKIAKKCGYEIKEVPYGNFPDGVKGSPEKMQQAFFQALEQTEEILKDVEFSQYESILFLSKSVGTAVAAAYAEKKHLKTENVFYTPVEQSFAFMKQPGIVFHGTKDPWAETDMVIKKCKESQHPVYLTEDANHSLETGDVLKDLQNMHEIMSLTEQYIQGETNESFI